jgi:outer membrane protein TolC
MNRLPSACGLSVLVVIATLAAQPSIAASPSPAAEIKELQQKRIANLDKAFKITALQYRVGTTYFSSVSTVERELLDARLDAAETPFQRMTALEESQKSADELLKNADARFTAARTSELDVDLGKALVLEIGIKLSRERHAAAAEIKESQQKRIALLEKASQIAIAQLRIGTMDFLGVKSIKRDLLEARLDVAETPSKHIAVLEGSLRSAEELVKAIDIIMQGRSNEPDLDLANAMVLEIKIRLLRERQAAGAEKK